jgi:hypothetical protein
VSDIRYSGHSTTRDWNNNSIRCSSHDAWRTRSDNQQRGRTMQHQQDAHCVTDQPISIEWKCHTARNSVCKSLSLQSHTRSLHVELDCASSHSSSYCITCGQQSICNNARVQSDERHQQTNKQTDRQTDNNEVWTTTSVGDEEEGGSSKE